MSTVLLDSFAVAVCVFFTVGIWRYHKALRLPPGPPATFLGNAHHIPRTENWVAFKKFANQHGPLICLWMFNSETIILNDYATANALLDHRSIIYSSRPTFWMSNIANRQDNLFFSKTTDSRFKIYRLLLHKTLNPGAIEAYRALQMTECQTLLKGLLEAPADFIAHIRRSAVGAIMSVAYGYQVKSIDDEFVKILERNLVLSASLNVPGKFLVEFLPILRYIPEWLPGAGFKRLARSVEKELRRLEDVPFKWATSHVATGLYEQSFISDHIHDQNFAPTEEEREDILRWCSAALYVGGGDTTVSIMTTFFFLMARHPKSQERAREEIDSVLGGNIATHDDRSSMPYMNALIKEVMRSGPVAPLGIPHEVTHDDYYNGFFIPKNTRIVANIWAMAYDEKVYPNPEIFDPTRFLGEDQQMDPMKFIFGFGRRICPGMHLAEATLFVNLTNILANFVISKKRGPDGQVIEPEARWKTGFTMHLEAFPCQITPRSPNGLRSMLMLLDAKSA